MRTRLQSLLGLTAALLLAAGCGGDDDGATAAGGGTATTATQPAKKHRVALFAPMANAPAKAEIEGMEEVAGEKVDFTRFDSAFDPQKEYRQVQDAIGTGRYDAFIIQTIGGATLKPLIEQAIAKGIKVGATNLALGPSEATYKPQIPGMTVAIVDPWSLRGQWMAQMLDRACEGKEPCDVGYVAGIATSPFESQFLDSMKEELKKFPNVKIAEQIDGGKYLREEGRKVCQTLLQKRKDFDVIASTADQAAQGCEIAMRAAGLKVGIEPGEIRLVAGGSSEYGIKAIKDGTWFGGWRWAPRDEGRKAMEIMLQALEGKDVKDMGISIGVEGEEQGVSPLVTKDSVGDFQAQWAG